MVDLAQVTGATIGGVSAPVFIGTPGLAGASQPNYLGGVIGAIANANPISSIANLLPNNPLSGGSIGNQASGFLSEIPDLFFRAVIIILGFIFLGVGLSMFKPPVVIQQTGAHVKRLAKKVKS